MAFDAVIGYVHDGYGATVADGLVATVWGIEQRQKVGRIEGSFHPGACTRLSLQGRIVCRRFEGITSTVGRIAGSQAWMIDLLSISRCSVGRRLDLGGAIRCSKLNSHRRPLIKCEATEGLTKKSFWMAITEHLAHEPMTPTRHRKPLDQNSLANWELRVQQFRVFYDVILEGDRQVVKIKAVGHKDHNKLYIGDREIQL